MYNELQSMKTKAKPFIWWQKNIEIAPVKNGQKIIIKGEWQSKQ